MQSVARPVLDIDRDYRDGAMVLVRPLLTGFCGSDRGIWYRRSFGDLIASSLDEEGRDVRVIGHELLGEIVQVPLCGCSPAAANYESVCGPTRLSFAPA